MSSKYLSFGMFIFLIAVNAEWSIFGFSDELHRLIREVDVISVEGDAEREVKWKDFSENLKSKLETFKQIAEQEMNKQKKTISTALKSVSQAVKNVVTNVDESLYQQLKNTWRQALHRFINVIKGDFGASKKEIAIPKEEVEKLLHNLEEEIKQHIGEDKWKQLGDDIKKELQQYQTNYNSQLRNMESFWNDVMRKVDRHISQKKGHHAIMKCQTCGKEYSFTEFLDMFDHEHNLAVSGKENYNDGSIEEYYEGWAIWANHLKLKCPVCEGSVWEDIIVEEDSPSKKKDEL